MNNNTTPYNKQPTITQGKPAPQASPSETPSSIIEAISVYTDKKKKPKRNRSAFILFSIDIRKKNQHEDLDELNPNDKFVKIAQLWKDLSEDERKIYEERAKKEKERYTSELSDFCRTFPSEPIQRPRNHIKKPCNAYGYYLKEVKESIRKESPGLRMCEVLRVVGERWKKLNAEDRQKYEKKAEISRKKFKADISKQSNEAKKVSTLKRIHTTTPHKGKEQQSSSKESLIVADPVMVKVAEEEIKQEHQTVPESSSQLTPTIDQENVLPNLPRIQVPMTAYSPNNPFEDTPSNSSHMSRYETVSGTPNQVKSSSFATGDDVNLLNVAAFVALRNLLTKVDYLRQQILLQLQLISARDERAQFPINREFLGLLEQLERISAAPELGSAPRSPWEGGKSFDTNFKNSN